MKSSKAIYYMIISVIAFALMNTVVKYLNNFSAYHIVFFRPICTLFFTIPLRYTSPIFAAIFAFLFLK